MNIREEILQKNDFAQLVDLAKDACDLCYEMAFHTGSKLEAYKNREIDYETAMSYFDTLTEMIDTAGGLVNEIYQIYCYVPYYEKVYKEGGRDLKEVNEYKAERLEVVETLRNELVALKTHYNFDAPLPFEEYNAIKDPEGGGE